MNETELTTLERDLLQLNQADDVGFQTLLNRAFDVMRLVETDLSREFGVSRPTVNRWLNGRSYPHPAVRKPVLEFLAARARKLATRASRQLNTSRPSEAPRISR